MKTILFVCPPELGHLLPTIEVARYLAELGHRILYLTASRFAPLLNSFGLEVIGLLPSVDEREAMLQSGWTYWYAYESITGLRAGLALLQHLKEVIDVFSVSGIVADTLYVDCYGKELRNFLISHRTFAIGITLPNWGQPVEINTDIPRAYLCPREFELPEFRSELRQVHYAEPSVLRNSDKPSIASETDRNKNVYVAFGTQSVMHSDLSRRFAMIAQLARRYRDYTFYLSCGASAFTPDYSDMFPDNISVVPFRNQQQYLSRANLFITHGGLGSIKESILEGVPMLVLPRLFDQPYNAIRVEKHRIGRALFPEELSVLTLSSAFARLIDSAKYTENIARFQRLMIHAEQNRQAAKLILAQLDRG